MKKPNANPINETDTLRPEYRRSDFGVMTRGKYAARAAESSNVVVLDPEVAKVFPNDAAVNKALLGLIELARSSAAKAPVSRKKTKP